MKVMTCVWIIVLAVSSNIYAQESIPRNQVFRLSNEIGHVYTSSKKEIKQFEKRGFSNEGFAFSIYNAKEGGTAPLYSFFNSSNGDCGLASLPERQAAFLEAGYEKKELIGFVHNEPRPNFVPLFEFAFNENDMFYTKSTEEVEGVMKDSPNIFVGIACYVWNGDKLYVPPSIKYNYLARSPISTTEKKSIRPLHLFVLKEDRTGLADIYWTIVDEEVSKLVIDDRYRYEGIVGKVLNSQFAGTIPVSRYYKESIDDYAFSSMLTESERLQNEGFIDQGVAFYLYDTSYQGTLPFYHLWDRADNHYVAGDEQKDIHIRNWGYMEKEILGYIIE